MKEAIKADIIDNEITVVDLFIKRVKSKTNI